jgi:hypothetical protein
MIGRLVLVLALIPGCARGSYVPVLDFRGSDEMLGFARQAAEEWWDVCGALVVVDRDAGGAPMTEYPVGGIPGFPERVGNTNIDWHGRVNWLDVQPDQHQRAVIVHEFGHALGLHHASSGIMQAVIQGDPHVTEVECSLLPR